MESEGLTVKQSQQVARLERSEVVRLEKVVNYVFQQSKKLFKNKIRNYINTTCAKNNLCPPSTSFQKKVKLLGFQSDEVSIGNCIDISEVESKLINLGLITKTEWVKNYSDWFSEGMNKFPSKIPDIENEDDPNDNLELYSENFTPVKKFRNFKGIKV